MPAGTFPTGHLEWQRPMGVRCPRRSVVVLAGDPGASDRPARELEQSLLELGVEAKYVGRERNAVCIADAIVRERADAVESAWWAVSVA